MHFQVLLDQVLNFSKGVGTVTIKNYNSLNHLEN